MNVIEQNRFVSVSASCAAFFAAAVVFTATANAATLTVAVGSAPSAGSHAVPVSVVLDTQGASANAVQGEITFPPALFMLGKISDGVSAVSLWITPPKETAPGVIGFAGIMPGGFDGADGGLFSFTLQPVADGTGTVAAASGTVLANDGSGTPLPVTLGSVSVSASLPAGTSTSALPASPPADDTTPNPFTPQIVRDPNMFGGKYFLVFSATDSGSGIDHYEVLEVPAGASTQPYSPWHEATSPYLLTDQNLSSDIYVRAVDHDGNFIVVRLPAEHPYATRNGGTLGFIVAILLAALVLSLFIWKRRRRGNP